MSVLNRLPTGLHWRKKPTTAAVCGQRFFWLRHCSLQLNLVYIHVSSWILTLFRGEEISLSSIMSEHRPSALLASLAPIVTLRKVFRQFEDDLLECSPSLIGAIMTTTSVPLLLSERLEVCLQVSDLLQWEFSFDWMMVSWKLEWRSRDRLCLYLKPQRVWRKACLYFTDIIL